VESKKDRKLEKALFYADSDDLGYKWGQIGVKRNFRKPANAFIYCVSGFTAYPNFSLSGKAGRLLCSDCQ